MSGIGNQYINLAPGDYATDVQRLQRQQRMADLLQQQAQEPLQAPQGAVAPISWTNVLAKAIQAWGARKQQEKIDQSYQGLAQQDRSSADALLAQLTKQTLAIAPQQTAVSGTMPSLPGQQAPQPQGPSQNINVGGAAPQAALSPMDQMAAIMAARGGPQTQMIQNAMLPQIMRRQERDDARLEPMTEAAREQIAAQGAQQQANARMANSLPPTAAENLAHQDRQAQLAAEQQKTNLMYGPGGGDNDPQVNYWLQAYASGAIPGLQNIPKRYQDRVAKALANQPADSPIFGPLAGRRFGMASTAIVGPMMKLPQYELTAQGLPYIQRIQAALKNPGSVSDQELLDSFTKLSTAGNAITDAQVRIITDGKSLKDWLNVVGQKLGSGGVLSPDQRQQISKIAAATYDKYREGYQPLYDEATSKLQAAGIPKAFWTIPDLNKLNAAQTGGGGNSMSDADKQALAWANANAKDPRAAAIKKKLGVP